MHRGPWNVYTILEIVYSGALRGESLLKLMICQLNEQNKITPRNTFNRLMY